MIGPTDEMRTAAYRAARTWAAEHGHAQPDDRMVDAVLAAALPIVERDYDVRHRASGPTDHAFEPHEDPRFGSAFGGGCGARVNDRVLGAVVCGWPRQAHRPTS